jgi:Fis family transcriptional regulator, factor for inversion stimulation protein
MRKQLEALVLKMHRGGILYREAVEEFKKTLLCTVFRSNHGNQSKTAKQLGMHRNTLTRTIVALHIDPKGTRLHSPRRPPQAQRQLLPHGKERLS